MRSRSGSPETVASSSSTSGVSSDAPESRATAATALVMSSGFARYSLARFFSRACASNPSGFPTMMTGMDLSPSSFLSLPTRRYPFWPPGSSTASTIAPGGWRRTRSMTPRPSDVSSTVCPRCWSAERRRLERAVSPSTIRTWVGIGEAKRLRPRTHGGQTSVLEPLPGISWRAGFCGGMGSIGSCRVGATTSGGWLAGAVGSMSRRVRRRSASSMSETSSYTSPPERQLAMLKPRTFRTRTSDHAPMEGIPARGPRPRSSPRRRSVPLRSDGWSWYTT